MTQTNIKQILDMLNTLEEQLLSLPDDILLSIDPRENESLERGMAFIMAFNNNMQQFTQSASKLSEQIKQHFGINPEEEELEQETDNRNKRERIVKELDKTQAYSLSDDFTYKRPFGYVLPNKAVKGIKTWKSLYISILNHLSTNNPTTFDQLPAHERFISKRGNPLFSVSGKELRVTEKLRPNFFVEVNLSANMIRNNIKELLIHFELNPSDLKIYLREDRDAQL
jgi:hypothetical protein